MFVSNRNLLTKSCQRSCIAYPRGLILGTDELFLNHFGNRVVCLYFSTKTKLSLQVLNSENLRSIMDGLNRNHLNKYSHVLTGYVGSVCFLTQIVTEISALKKLNPSLRYHCDPVLGDNEEFYVPEDLVQIYRLDRSTLVYSVGITPALMFEKQKNHDAEVPRVEFDPASTSSSLIVNFSSIFAHLKSYESRIRRWKTRL